MKALRVSMDLMDYLEEKKDVSLKVHSTFNGAINLIGEEQHLISLVDCSKEIGPMSLQMDFNQCVRNLQSGDSLRMTREGLILPRAHHVSFCDAFLWNPELSIKPVLQDPQLLEKKLAQIRVVLEEEGAKQGISPLIDECRTTCNSYCSFIMERYHSLMDHFRRMDLNGIRNGLSGFLGFGPGLTPSTDDFMAGVLLTLWVLSREDHEELRVLLKDIPSIALGKTTRVSEEMLLHAAQGKTGESYQTLVERLFSEDCLDLTEAARHAVCIGSTSGTDFLFGLYMINRIRLENRSVYHGFI